MILTESPQRALCVQCHSDTGGGMPGAGGHGSSDARRPPGQP
jgi:hypothetical protein